jgi:hypothetical protein
VDQSLVVFSERAGTSRYRLLETFRQFGLARLDDVAAVHARHARHYLERVREMKRRSAEQGGGDLRSLIEAELSNVRAAFQFAHARGDAELCTGLVSELTAYAELRPTLELAEWAEAALNMPRRRPDLCTVRAHLAASIVHHYAADWVRAEHHAREALRIDGLCGTGLAAAALTHLAPPLAYQGRVAEALRAAKLAGGLAPPPLAALAPPQPTGSPALEPSASARSPNVSRQREFAGRPELALAPGAGSSAARLAASRYVLVFVQLYVGEPPDLDELGQLAAEERRPSLRPYALGSYATACLAAGAPDQAAFDEAIVAADRIGHAHMACLHRSYAALARAGGDPVEALGGLRVALVEYGAVDLPFGPRQIAADHLGNFAALGRWSTIALIDGASPPVSIFPAAARRAKAAARQALGERRYAASARLGRAMPHDELFGSLHDELDALGVRRAPPTVGAR